MDKSDKGNNNKRNWINIYETNEMISECVFFDEFRLIPYSTYSSYDIRYMVYGNMLMPG